MRDLLIEQLKDNIVLVEFTKKDGTVRAMKATLRGDILPQATKEDPLSQKKIRSINEEVIPCWDTENEGWRSFRVDSVVRYEVVAQG
jgi:hypothetical protein